MQLLFINIYYQKKGQKKYPDIHPGISFIN